MAAHKGHRTRRYGHTIFAALRTGELMIFVSDPFVVTVRRGETAEPVLGGRPQKLGRPTVGSTPPM